MNVRSRLFIEVLVMVFLLTGPAVSWATKCGGEIEFCSEVSSTESGVSPITCQSEFVGGAIPVTIQSGYVLLKVNNAAQGVVAIAVFKDPTGLELETRFDFWQQNYATWYEVVDLPIQKLQESPGTWTFTYYVKPPYSPNREELCSTTFVVGETSTPDIDGIWKDTGQTISFYVQTYTTGSAVIIATKDLSTFYVFLDSNVGDGVNVNDLAGHGHHLTATFNDDTHATADLTPSGSALQSYTLSKANGIPSNPSNHGIWKTPSCSGATMNYYVQTYNAGSAIVIGTADLSSIYVFLDTNFSDGIDTNEMSGKSVHLSMGFSSSGLGDSMECCAEAPRKGSSISAQASCSLTNTGGTGPQILLSPQALDFGNVIVDHHQYLDKTFTIRNTGSSTLTVNNMTGLPSNGFYFTDLIILPFSVFPDESEAVTVRFKPDSVGAKSASISILSNGDNGNPSSDSVGLSGSGTDAGGATGGLSDITVGAIYIAIRIWDPAVEDGDTIDLLINGSTVLSNVNITNSEELIFFGLEDGENTLTIRAVNEGSVSPNTGSIAFSDVLAGEEEQNWSLETGETATMTITAPVSILLDAGFSGNHAAAGW